MVYRGELTIATPGRGTLDVTAQVAALVGKSGIREGIATAWIHHTSASLMICENASPAVRRDLEAFLSRLVPDGDPAFEHDEEGPDDMPAHVRTVLTQTSITIPLIAGRLALGTWQGLYLYEHRHAPHSRRVTVTVVGDP